MLLSALREWDRRLECLGVVNQPLMFECDFEVLGCIVRYARRNGYGLKKTPIAVATRVRVFYIDIRRESTPLDFEVTPGVTPGEKGFMIACSRNGAQLGPPQFISRYSTEKECNAVVEAFFRLCDSVPVPHMGLSALREWDRGLEFLASSDQVVVQTPEVGWTSYAVAECIEAYANREKYTCKRSFLYKGYSVSICSGVSEETPVDIYVDIVPRQYGTVTIVCCTKNDDQIGAPVSVDRNSTEADCERIIEGFLKSAKQLKPSGSR
jgi:hypothetical protein